MYECIWMCVFCMPERGGGGPVSWWAVWSGPGHLDNKGMKCSHCLKFTGRYAACTVVWLSRRGTQREGCREVSQGNVEMWGEWRLGGTERKTSAYCKQRDVSAGPHQRTDAAPTELISRTLSDCLRSRTKASVTVWFQSCVIRFERFPRRWIRPWTGAGVCEQKMTAEFTVV